MSMGSRSCLRLDPRACLLATVISAGVGVEGPSRTTTRIRCSTNPQSIWLYLCSSTFDFLISRLSFNSHGDCPDRYHTDQRIPRKHPRAQLLTLSSACPGGRILSRVTRGQR
ncbi:hypothetical protein B0H15DRAFT_852217, partial [Mycena belliarum]